MSVFVCLGALVRRLLLWPHGCSGRLLGRAAWCARGRRPAREPRPGAIADERRQRVEALLPPFVAA
ncbi:MAG: hypothetical protein ACFN4K_09725, partial [Pauljensenia sp.]